METKLTRWQFWRSLSIRRKLLVGFVGVGVALMLLMGTVAYFGVRGAVEAQVFAKLVALRENRAAVLLRWFGERRRDIENLSSNGVLQQYVREVESAIERDASLGETFAERLLTIRERYLGMSKLEDAGDGSAYSRAHRNLFPFLANYLELHGYYDIFLVSPDGSVLFTVVKEDDFGTNLVDGPYAGTNIARAFNSVLHTHQASVITDFSYYEPSGEPAAFISAPVIDAGSLVGVLIFQVPIDVLNEILNDNAGLGQTGETYVVGPDSLFRNDSRFKPANEPSMILNSAYEVNTAASRAVFQEGKGNQESSALIEGYQGDPVLSAWRPVVLQEAKEGVIDPVIWALIAEIDRAEAFRPMRTLLLGLGSVAGLGVVLLVGVIYFMDDQITRPIQNLTEVARELAVGDFSQRAEVITKDEIGVLAETFNQMARELQEAIISLEVRVAERTHILQAAAEVSQATTLILDPQELMYRVVELVRESFDLYYVGLFLVDKENYYAVLRAGTGQAGQQMLIQGHKLEIGGASLIGQAVAKAEAQIERDVDEAKIHFRNPLLPKTRAEMALPLRSRGRTLGAMTIQGEDVSVFDDVNIKVMQTMADQVAAVIDNAQLFAATEAALARAEASVEVSERAARRAGHRARHAGELHYETRQPGMPPMGFIEPDVIKKALARQGAVTLDDQYADHVALVGPVMLHGEVIGALGIYDQNRSRTWTEDEISLFEDVLERMALVAENRQLISQTRARAEREQLLREISDQMQQARDMKSLMQVTAEALTEMLEGSRAYVRLGIDDTSDDGHIDITEEEDGESS